MAVFAGSMVIRLGLRLRVWGHFESPEIFGIGFGALLKPSNLCSQKSLGQGLGHLKTGHFGLSFETDGLRIFYRRKSSAIL